MQRPLKITSRDFPLSEAVETEIREKASALENYYERLSGCEVTVQAPAIKHHRKGGPFLVGIRLTVPGKELAVDCQAEEELSQASVKHSMPRVGSWKTTFGNCAAR